MAKKRGQNEGSIYQRKDGSWVGAVSIQGRRLSHYAKTQKEARDWLKTTLAQVENGLTFAGAQAKVGEYMEYWLRIIETTVRPRTLEQYQQVARQYIIPVLGSIKLKDLRPDQIQAMYNAYLDRGMSRRNVIMVHAVLHRAFVHALKQGLVSRNPVDAVTRPKLQHTEMHTLDDKQVRTLLLAVQGTIWDAFYYVEITTGLRQGEILGLKWNDLDWHTKQLHVQRQVQRIHGQGMVYSEPKTKAGRRVIVLGQTTIEKLRKHVELQQLEREVAGLRWKDNDLIFPTSIGTPVEPTNLLKRYKALLDQCGLPDIRFHDLRHTAATLMLQQGVHPKVVQERLGHSEIGMTLNTYSHVIPSMQEDAADKMDEIISPINVSNEFKKLTAP
jgi:integrase